MTDNIVVAVRVRSLIARELNDPIHWQVKDGVLSHVENKKIINSYHFGMS